jgi:hypothetical protein
MKLHLEWTHQISLRSAAQQDLIYWVSQDKLPSVAGVYVFGRRYSDGFEALYYP